MEVHGNAWKTSTDGGFFNGFSSIDILKCWRVYPFWSSHKLDLHPPPLGKDADNLTGEDEACASLQP